MASSYINLSANLGVGDFSLTLPISPAMLHLLRLFIVASCASMVATWTTLNTRQSQWPELDKNLTASVHQVADAVSPTCAQDEHCHLLKTNLVILRSFYIESLTLRLSPYLHYRCWSVNVSTEVCLLT
jgi:hypothetical protein